MPTSLGSFLESLVKCQELTPADNGIFSSDEILDGSQYGVVVVSRPSYWSCVDILTAGSWLTLFPYASEGLGVFLTPTSSMGTSSSVTLVNRSELTHAVGASFNKNGVASTMEYQFNSTSGLSDKIAKSDAMNALIQSALNDTSNKSAVVNHFTANPASGPTKFYFPINSSSIVFHHGGGLGDADLYLLLGSATFSGNVEVTVNHSLEVEELKIHAEITDTYDFDHDRSPPNDNAAATQAGFPTLGSSGRVYKTRVNISQSIPGYVHTF